MERHVRSTTKRQTKVGYRNNEWKIVHFIDPVDAEIKETIQKNARRKLEVPMPPAMPCKIRERTYKATYRNPDLPKTKYAVEADESR